MTTFLRIDGAMGEGGGQVLRSAMSLSALTQTPIEIVNIRANRAKPGLMRQHLTSIKAVAQICGGQLTGAELRSNAIQFIPQSIQAGDYHFAIGTAGSTTLVCQTVLPVLVHATAASTIRLEGGTHNGLSPSLDFLTQTFFPRLQRIGIQTEVQIQQLGFNPAGGGDWQIRVYPCQKLGSIEFMQPPQDQRHIYALGSRIPEHVLQRELAAAQSHHGWENAAQQQVMIKAPGSGNFFAARIGDEQHRIQFEQSGAIGTRAETVVHRTLRAANHFIASGAAIDEHLADQLLLYMALAGQGCFTTTEPSLHTQTNIQVIEMFLPVRFYQTQIREQVWEIGV